MPGVKGRSGGKRAGAGRKPKAGAQKAPAKAETSQATAPAGSPEAQVLDEVVTADGTQPAGRRDPLTFLEDVLNLPGAPLKDRIRSAIAAAQYRHTKLHDGGKKDDTADKAKKAAVGKFRAAPAPLKLIQR